MEEEAKIGGRKRNKRREERASTTLLFYSTVFLDSLPFGGRIRHPEIRREDREN